MFCFFQVPHGVLINHLATTFRRREGIRGVSYSLDTNLNKFTVTVTTVTVTVTVNLLDNHVVKPWPWSGGFCDSVHSELTVQNVLRSKPWGPEKGMALTVTATVTRPFVPGPTSCPCQWHIHAHAHPVSVSIHIEHGYRFAWAPGAHANLAAQLPDLRKSLVTWPGHNSIGEDHRILVSKYIQVCN